jgi:uncharacterized protein YndB with AHSA1/START domain
MIVYAAISAILLAVFFFGYVSTRPDTFRVQRSAVIDAPPAQTFPFIEDFRQFALWSPYEKLDPGMTRTFSGAKRGKGAVYEWHGKGAAGKGRMEIAHTSPPRMVVIRLDFIKPFETQNIVEFTLEEEDSATRVTWSMRGANPYIAKLIQLLFSMDRVVGKDFEAGLSNLKALVEGQSEEVGPRYASTG